MEYNSSSDMEILNEMDLYVPYKDNSSEMFQEDMITSLQTQVISKLSNIFSLPPNQSSDILIQNQWNLEKSMEKILENRISLPKSQINPKKPFLLLCNICLNQKVSAQTRYLECNHAFCINCYAEYLINSINSGPNSIITQCPMDNCRTIVTRDLFEELLPKEVFFKYEMYVKNSFVNNRKNAKWCPSPGCKYGVEALRKINKEINCKCGYSWCFTCGEESHKPISCELFNKWNQVLSENDKNEKNKREMWDRSNTKRCPSCKSGIEKNRGCNHMTCRCGYEFCWLCLGDWKEHKNMYICNPLQGNYDNSEIAREINPNATLAEYDSERFQHYLLRYRNHKSSLLQSKLKIEACENSLNYIYQILQESIGFSFYLRALKFLYSAKNSLAYTYALGYYLISPSKVRFYEFIQGELESTIYKLDVLTDKNPESFIEVNGQKGKIKPELNEFRERVIDLTTKVKKYFYRCMKQMENNFPDVEEERILELYAWRSLNDDSIREFWECKVCTLHNELDVVECTACQSQRQMVRFILIRNN